MEPPVRPLDSDCCGQGCNPCIFDIYEQQLQRYYSKKCCEGPSACTENCLSQNSYTAFKLTDIKTDVEDTFKYTFKFFQKAEPCDQNCSLIIKPGQHLYMQGDLLENGKLISKPYAVVINKKDKLSFDLVFKLWPNGQMSNYAREFSLGDIVHFRGPYGDFKINYQWGHVLLIAQGTGITPAYAVISDMLDNYKCETSLRLFHCCHDHDNINFRHELNQLAKFCTFDYEIFLGEESEKCFTKLHNEVVHLRPLEEHDIEVYFKEKENLQNTTFRVIICGTNEFVGLIKLYLIRCGIDRECIHRF